MQPGVVGVKDSALKRLVGNPVKLPYSAGEQNFSANAVEVLVLEARGRFPTAGVIFVAKRFVERDRLKMLFLIDGGNAFGFVDHKTLRIVRQPDRRLTVDNQPNAFGNAGRI